MKAQTYLVLFAICLILNSCDIFGGKDLKEKKFYHLDIVIVDNPDALSGELGKIYEPIEDKDNENIVHIVLSEKDDKYPSYITRIDINSKPKINVFFDAGSVGNFMSWLSPNKTTIADLNFDIGKSLEKLDLTPLNSNELVDEKSKTKAINDFIADKKTVYKEIYFYSENALSAKFGNNNEYTVYHNIDSIRQSISSKMNQNKSARILLVYNPPAFVSQSDTVAPATVDTVEKVIEEVSVIGVTLSPTSQTLLVGNTLQLTATVLPDSAANKAVSWESDKTAVAAVDENGKVNALAEGAATITVKTQDGGKTATCSIEVIKQQVSVTGVSLSPTSQTLLVGNTLQLKATVLPDSAANKAVSWESDNMAVATVDENGKVKTLAEGTAKITVKTQDGDKTATCNIKVTNCTVTVSCGKYEGESKNCKPHGMGTIRYTCHVQICPSDPEKRCAEAGQYLVGQFRDGNLLQGKVHDRDGTQLFVIICGGGAH